MAKQTFTTGQVLTAAQMTSLQQTAMLGGAASAKTASYTLVATDAGTAISMSNASATTITVNTALFAAGDTVQITNLGVGVCTITAGTATVNTSATLALAQYESGTLNFTSTSAAIFIKGAGAAAGGGSGLTFISGASFTSSSAVNVNNCFSASYKNYLIIGSITSNSTQVNVGIRMRVSGTDNTTADYDRGNISNFTTNVTGGQSLNASSWTEVISTYASSTGNNFRIEMFNPFATEYTTGFATSASFNSTDYNQQLVGLNKPVTTSFDGFSLIANTGNITGYYKVYGLADA